MKNSLLIIIVFCFFYGCSSRPAVVNTEQPMKTQSLTPYTDISTAYPVDAIYASQPYPIDTLSTPQASNILQPSIPNDGYALIIGKLMYGATQIPQSNTRVVLVPARKADNKFLLPEIITSGFPELGDFIGSTDEQGNFQISNILPGDYFLIVNFPDETVVGSKEGKEFLITLGKNQVMDLGILSLE
jgi:hypothetical protein